MTHSILNIYLDVKVLTSLSIIICSVYYWRKYTKDKTQMVNKSRSPRELLFPEDIKIVILSYIRKYGDDYLDQTVEFGNLSTVVSNGTISYESIVSYNLGCYRENFTYDIIKIRALSRNDETGEIEYYDWDTEEFNNKQLPLVLGTETHIAFIRGKNNIKKWKDNRFNTGVDIILTYTKAFEVPNCKRMGLTIPKIPPNFDFGTNVKLVNGIIDSMEKPVIAINANIV
uniref:Uncharacterized protein n=1 Tax=viral metagenome TaxID=1070528 RepID=A0A6C0BTN0_9ZZZZ